MQLNQLQRKNRNKRKKRVGRGGKRGKTSGRGHKGQKARAGHRIRPEMRDVIKKIPKRRGYRFKAINPKPVIVSLSSIDKTFSDGDRITSKTLIDRGLVRKRKGKIPAIKILARLTGEQAVGELSKKVTISGIAISENAKSQIEKAGGSVLGK